MTEPNNSGELQPPQPPPGVQPAVPPPPVKHGAPPPVPATGNDDLSKPQRQSPLAMLFLVLRFVRSIGIVQLVVAVGFVLSRSPSIPALALGITVIGTVLLAISALGWWRYTFVVIDGELRVEQGVLSRQRLTIPLDRVQAVSIQQKFLHRIVGLVEVSADSAGTAASEFTIDAVQRSVAESLQAAAANHRTNAAASAVTQSPTLGGIGATGVPPANPPQVDRVVLRRTPGELLKIALTQFPLSGLAVLAPLLAFSGQLVDLLPDDGFPEFSIDVGGALIWFVPVVLVSITLVSVLLQVVRVFLVHWDLTVTETGSGLRKNAGLLSKSSTASSLPRLQLVRVSQSALTRLVGINHVSLIGIRSTPSAEQLIAGGGGTISIPGSSDAEVAELRRLGLDGAPGVPHLDRRVSPQEVFRETRNAVVVVVLLIIGLWLTVLGAWSLLAVLLIPWRWLVVRRTTRLRRWGVSVDAIAEQNEFFTQVRSEALLRKMNSVTITQTLFERKRDLATLSIGLAGVSVTVGMIPLVEAKAVRDGALFVAETDRRAFM